MDPHQPHHTGQPTTKPSPNPQPPTPDDVTRILTHAWSTPTLGVLIWLAIITGARRGELCALRWTDFHPDRHVIYIVRSIALDPDTTALLIAYRHYRELLAASSGVTLPSDAFMFTLLVDGSRCLVPSSLSQRYHRLVTHLDIRTTLHNCATELILAKVDIRTVASRLGHTDAGLTSTPTPPGSAKPTNTRPRLLLNASPSA